MTELAMRARSFASSNIQNGLSRFESFSSSLRACVPEYLLPQPKLVDLIYDHQRFSDALRKRNHSHGALAAAFYLSLHKGEIKNVETMEALGLIPAPLKLGLMTSMITRIQDDATIDQALEAVGHHYEANEVAFKDLAGDLFAAGRHHATIESIYRGATLHTGGVMPLARQGIEVGWLKEQILAFCKALRSESYMSALDSVCGKTGQKIRKSDAFNREAPHYKSNFTAVALYAIYISAMLGGEGRKEEILASLLGADIQRIENTKGMSWKKYRQLEKSHLGRIDTFVDAIKEVEDCLVLPIALMHGYSSCVARDLLDLRSIAGRLIVQGKSSLDFAGINESWHKMGNGLPETCRPLQSFYHWSPLFHGEMQLGQDFSMVALYSKRQLKEEGRALDHCVGSASYAQSCVSGRCQILSLRRKGKPLATIELCRGKVARAEQLIDKENQQWFVGQFRGEQNGRPSDSAHRALSKFAGLVKTNAIKLLDVIEPTRATRSVDDDSSAELEQRMGFRLKSAPEILPIILNHYNTRVRLMKNDGSIVPLIQETDLARLEQQVLQCLQPSSVPD